MGRGQRIDERPEPPAGPRRQQAINAI